MTHGVGEIRVTDPTTGGQKGTKPQRYDLISTYGLDQLARVYGYGVEKYADRNWEKGYKWGLSFAAMCRHIFAFWRGEYFDDESELPHLAHAAWHCFTLMEFATFRRGTDDRSQLNTNANLINTMIGDKS